jgi:hypothetical protein
MYTPESERSTNPTKSSIWKSRINHAAFFSLIGRSGSEVRPVSVPSMMIQARAAVLIC